MLNNSFLEEKSALVSSVCRFRVASVPLVVRFHVYMTSLEVESVRDAWPYAHCVDIRDRVPSRRTVAKCDGRIRK